jgi:hypothetical protein
MESIHAVSHGITQYRDVTIRKFCICAKTTGSNPVSVSLAAWLPGFVLKEVYPGLRKFAYLIYALGVVKMVD